MPEMKRTTLLAEVVRRMLRQQVTIVIVVLVLLGALLTGLGITGQSRARADGLEALGIAGAGTLGRQAAVPLDMMELQGTAAVDKVVQITRQMHADVLYAAVVDKSGKVVSSSMSELAQRLKLTVQVSIPERLGGPTATDVAQAGLEMRQYVALVGDKADGTQATAPAPSETGGAATTAGAAPQGGAPGAQYFAVVAFDLSRIRAETASARNWSLFITILITALCAALISYMAVSIYRRVHALGDQVGSSVQELRAAASEIVAVAGQTETNSENQAASVDETRRTMEGMLKAANEIAEGADSVVQTAERSTSASGVIAERIARLNSQAMKITDISETIRGIADKSDILALNAALEGTKAGEAGRGFALVGSEMRRLAETIMDAVRQIKQLASEIRELSQAAVLAGEEGQKIAAETTETARRITLITNQQRTATQQVTQAMNEIQEFTKQAISGAKQARSTANDLVRTAGELSGLLEGKQTPEPARRGMTRQVATSEL